jgi:hypothetical protein
MGKQPFIGHQMGQRRPAKTADTLRLGWRVVRVSSDLLLERPEVVIARVLDALREAAAPWPDRENATGDAIFE